MSNTSLPNRPKGRDCAVSIVSAPAAVDVSWLVCYTNIERTRKHERLSARRQKTVVGRTCWLEEMQTNRQAEFDEKASKWSY